MSTLSQEVELDGHYQVQRSKVINDPGYSEPVLLTQYGWAKRGHETNWYDQKVEKIREAKHMKWIPDPFRSDVVELTWWDLLRLALGREVKDSALIARRARRKLTNQ